MSKRGRIQNRISVHKLITDDLGYCCTWLFFKLYPGSDLIAARLGVTTRAVRMNRAKAECECAGNPRCIRGRLRE